MCSGVGGTTTPVPGDYGISFSPPYPGTNVTANPNAGYVLDHWILDGTTVHGTGNTYYVPTDGDHTIQPVFSRVLCASKTNTYGCFYVPNATILNVTSLKVEMLFNDTHLVGDQTGNATTPYPAIKAYPDNVTDMMDISFMGGKLMSVPGDSKWDYMGDVNHDGIIDMMDIFAAANNFMQSGSYIYNLSNVTITFNTGPPPISPDANGFWAIPLGATSFNVTQNGKGIGAMIIFCGP